MDNRRIVFNLDELRLSKFNVAFIEPVNYVITSLIYRRNICKIIKIWYTYLAGLNLLHESIIPSIYDCICYT